MLKKEHDRLKKEIKKLMAREYQDLPLEIQPSITISQTATLHEGGWFTTPLISGLIASVLLLIIIL